MTSEELLALIPDRPLVVYTHAGQRGIWMDDRGDLRFVASCNDNRGDYTTVLAAAPTALRDALAEVARLTAEVERLSAMVPRWTKSKGGGVWSLVVGRAHHIATVERHYDNFRAWTRLAGEVHAMPVAVEPDLPTACRAVCARLGLPYIAPPETP